MPGRGAAAVPNEGWPLLKPLNIFKTSDFLICFFKKTLSFRDTTLCYIHFRANGTMEPCVINAAGVNAHDLASVVQVRPPHQRDDMWVERQGCASSL